MTTAHAPSSLARLRAKTDRQLAVLLRRELDRGWSFIRRDQPCDAVRSYESAETLFAMVELPEHQRIRLQQKLEQLREALPRCAMSAA